MAPPLRSLPVITDTTSTLKTLLSRRVNEMHRTTLTVYLCRIDFVLSIVHFIRMYFNQFITTANEFNELPRGVLKYTDIVFVVKKLISFIKISQLL